MSTGRVAGSQTAKAEINQMKGDFQNTLDTMKSQFQRHNSVLTNPQEWDGNHANKYKNEVMPQINSMIQKWQTDLNHLTSQMDRIMADILSAGGN